MLFPYKYVPHQIEKMQEFIDFIFHQVWCKAPSGGHFRLELFDGNPDLKGVMTLFQVGDTKAGDFFYGHVDRIYGHFASLSPVQVDQFKGWYEANNEIEKACGNHSALQLGRYADIQPINAALCEELATFFKGLYSEKLGIAALKEQIGEIDEHYHCFMEINSSSKCPFCGIADIKGMYHTKRDAYDHYLPKAFYPFNSINFRNLAPACHDCNSAYKGVKDPLNCNGERRRAFYPYAVGSPTIQIQISINRANIVNLKPEDIRMEFGPELVKEEIETWKDVYGIEERYKAKCCSGDAMDWLEQVRMLQQDHGVDAKSYLTTVAQLTSLQPFANANFLKKAFLESYIGMGLFSQAAGDAT